MNRITKWVFCSVFSLLSFCAVAADYLAIAEPVAKGMKAEDIEGLWGILEVSVNSTEYTLISRAALKQMMTEIGLQTSSDLVNMNSVQKTRLGEISAVKYLLITEVAKFGTKYNCTMRIIDGSTGEIDQARTENLRVNDLDELADKIEYSVKRLLSDNKQLQSSAMLSPVVRVKNPPDYLPTDFTAYLESSLLERGAKLQNLQSVNKILAKNNLDALFELEPKMFMKVGKLLEVQTLLQATLTRFEVVSIKRYIEESGVTRVSVIGTMEGNVRVISAQTGEVAASVPFSNKIDFTRLPSSYTLNWTVEDYGQELIKRTVAEKVIPKLLAPRTVK